MLAFAAGFFDSVILSFLAGCFGTFALILRQFSSFSIKESSERTQQVNKVLQKLGIDEIVDIAIDSTASNAIVINTTEKNDNEPNIKEV